MRVVVDALAATPHGGGVGTYVRGLLAGWAQSAPADELTVLLTRPFGEDLVLDPRYSGYRFHVCSERHPRVAWRLARAEALLPTLQSNADALLSTITSSPLGWRKPAVTIVHDLRHEDRPADFSRLQRTFRRIQFRAAYHRAGRLVADSDRTAQALRARHRETSSRVMVVHLGADHVPRRLSTRDGDVLALGHYANKEPGLLLQVWEILLRTALHQVHRLHIVGLGDRQRESLARDARRLGVADYVTLDAFLDAATFERLLGAARALLLPSRYEGFGLPVLEGMRQGIPVMISPDPALAEVAGGYAASATSWAPEDLATATQHALQMTDSEVTAAQQHSDRFTWRRTAELTRASIQDAIHTRSAR